MLISYLYVFLNQLPNVKKQVLYSKIKTIVKGRRIKANGGIMGSNGDSGSWTKWKVVPNEANL